MTLLQYAVRGLQYTVTVLQYTVTVLQYAMTVLQYTVTVLQYAGQDFVKIIIGPYNIVWVGGSIDSCTV